jgi:hypothetical protein
MTPHAHYWLIPSVKPGSRAKTVEGVCKTCGATREFFTRIVDEGESFTEQERRRKVREGKA